MEKSILIYILVMAAVTYSIRAVPLILLRKEIQNDYIKSFLFYMPYVTLSVMIVPAIFVATNHMVSAIAAFIVAIVSAYKGFSLIWVALFTCLTALGFEVLLMNVM